MRILFFVCLGTLLLLSACSSDEAQVKPQSPVTANRNGVRETVTVGFWYGSGAISVSNGTGTASFTLDPAALREALGVSSLTVVSAEVKKAYLAARAGEINFQSGEYTVDWPKKICCALNKPCCWAGGGGGGNSGEQEFIYGDVQVFNLNDDAALGALLQEQEPATFSARLAHGTATEAATVGVYVEATLVVE